MDEEQKKSIEENWTFILSAEELYGHLKEPAMHLSFSQQVKMNDMLL